MKGQIAFQFLITIGLLAALLGAPGQQSVTAAQIPAQPDGADRDGYADLAIGIPGRDIGVVNSAGMVGVVYGAAVQLDYDFGQTFDKGTTGIFGDPSVLDHFGEALADGDFNCDGYLDLAIGIPGETIGAATNAGAVEVLYGNGSGITTTDSDLWWHSDLGTNTAETGDRFGAALTAGNFNGDGCDDLAIGVPGQDFAGVEAVGYVHVIYGSSVGLTNINWSAFLQAAGIQEFPEETDNFGSVLASGDFDGDGFDDLAIGTPMEDVTVGTTTYTDAGVVQVVYGSAGGLSIDGDELFYQGYEGLQDEPDDFDHFGAALAAGRFNQDKYFDLAIGVPDEDIFGTDAGAVQLLYSDFSGPNTDIDQRFWQALLPGQTNVADELFGYALASGDFDGNGLDDLAIGAPGQEVSGGAAAGTVHVLFGNAPLASAFTEPNPVPHAGDQYGYSLAAGDLNGDGYDELVASAPYYDYSSPTITSSGVLYTTYSDQNGPDPDTIQFGAINWVTSNDLFPELNDQFGAALAVLDEPHYVLEALYLPIIMK